MNRAAYGMGVGQGYIAAKDKIGRWYPDAVLMWKIGVVVGYLGARLGISITVLRGK